MGSRLTVMSSVPFNYVTGYTSRGNRFTVQALVKGGWSVKINNKVVHKAGTKKTALSYVRRKY